MLLPGAGLPARAAQQLVVRFDGLQLPIDLQELEAWSRDPRSQRGSLAPWLQLLDPQARLGLARLLRAPLLRDRGFGMELLNSWTGTQMLREVGGLLRGPGDENTAPALLATLQRLFARQPVVSSLELLQALPQERLTLQVDGLLTLAGYWRDQLRHQVQAVEQLRALPLPAHRSRPLLSATRLRSGVTPQRLLLPVPHRSTPLPLELWTGSGETAGRPWLLVMPGLGGSSSQLRWLAQDLAERGWPVLLLDHPGSDELAVKAALLGEGPPPGAESVPLRLADLQAVLSARSEGRLPDLAGAAGSDGADSGVVLLGHSLGGLAALMATGLPPEAGLARRCREALAALPLTNLSRLLQCQLLAVTGDGAPLVQAPGAVPPASSSAPAGVPHLAGVPLHGVVTFNGFGSLLWPQRGLSDLPVPVLMVGGSLDLVTPPVQEQLQLLASSAHPRSRLVLVDGGSHFSPVRLQTDDQALFRLGDELVGEAPQQVQSLLLQLTLEFLHSERHPALLTPQRRDHGGVQAYVLDPARARRWRDRLPAPIAPPR